MIVLGVTLSLLGSSCLSRFQADQRDVLTVEACCKTATADMRTFRGCRTTPVCTTDEPLWLRGELECGPLQVEACEGGRCCRYIGVPPSQLTTADALGPATAPDPRQP